MKPKKEYLTIKDAADLLQVTPRTVRNYLIRKHNPIPHSKPCGRILIPAKPLLKWITNN